MTTEERAFGSQLRAPQGRRVLDTAQGILIGLRRCDTDAAFQELVRTAHTHVVPVFTMASALVALATGTVHFSRLPERAQAVARDTWGSLLDGSPTNGASAWSIDDFYRADGE
ncbi:ANTAR domain-containing protein [Mycobacterium kyogaense]|uniref:ANTAR domain-containing protein n=1 Tax=Mycobacterium kyogaense TaxID=2212479 RepID=UPI000DAD8B2C|nr:ANTAR domain-containing protein [Mycobacterium kyogaense]